MAEVVTFDPSVVEAVCRHMNDDHADDALLIVRALGGVEETDAARMAGFDSAGADYVAVVDGAEQTVRVPFSLPATDRLGVRKAVVQQYTDACEAAGIEPRGEGG